MITVYPLEWIDSLILQTLNPKNTNISDLSQNDLAYIAENLSKESRKIQIQLQNEIFSLQKKRQIRLLVRKYHSALVYLLDKVIEHQNDNAFKTGIISSILALIVVTLDDLLFFIENRYHSYINLDERVPIPYLLVSKKEILSKLEKLRKKTVKHESDNQISEIIFAAISGSNLIKGEYKVTYREIIYLKELLKCLDALVTKKESTRFYSLTDELLIEMNFNYQDYIIYFTGQIEKSLALKPTLIEKLDELLIYYKEFSQLLSNETITYDPAKQHIKYVLNNWFKHEIGYLDRKIELLENTGSSSNSNQMLAEEDSKVQCELSTDQMGLILRAGDEARILKAKSMSQVFKSIVPHLSSIRKKDLSYDSMRSKSYMAEERDKDIAIKSLEKIIKHIKEF